MTEQAPQADASPPQEVPPDPAPEDIVRQEVETNQDPSIPLDREHTQAELDAAAEEIKMLTPESWIETVEYLHSLEDIAKLGEAPGIAWTNLYSEKTGGQMNITARALTPKAAVEDMFDAVKYVMSWQSHMRWSTQKTYAKAPAQTSAPAQAPAQTSAPPASAPANALPEEPTYVPVASTGVEKFTVGSVEHAISKNNHPFVRVKTVEGAFAKYGVNAWKEVVPVDFESWPTGQEYQPPPEMKFCLVDTTQSPKKVTAFTTE